MGDRGLPKSWRHMDGYGSHTYQWINAAGERFWVKYHFKTNQGIEYLTQDEADALAGSDAGLPPPATCRQSIDDRRLPALDAARAGHAVRGRRRATASTRST